MKDKTFIRVGKTSQRDQFIQKFIDFGILGLIVISPLPAASVPEWAILFIQLVVLIMIIAYLFMKQVPIAHPALSPALKWPRYMFWGLFLFLILQIIPMFKSVVSFLSPQTLAFHNQFSLDFINVKYLSISLIPAHSLREGLELLTYFMLGFLIIKTVTHRRQIVRILVVMVTMGVFQALYGLFELYNKNPRILFYSKIYNLDSATGTFVNRNHFSGYLEMIVPIAIGLLIARIDIFKRSGIGWSQGMLRFSEKKMSGNLMITFGIIIMSLGIVLSKSRSGIFLLLFSFFLIFGLLVLFYRSADSQKRRSNMVIAIVFVVIVIFSLQIGIGSALDRFSIDDLLNEGRPVFWKNTLSLFTKSPIFGLGLGTFPSLYPDWEVEGNSISLNHAHNDYLEYLAELGIVGFTLLIGGLFFIIGHCFKVWRFRRNLEIKGLVLGCFVAVFCILIHSITDFNMHIPANALLFTIVLSLTIVLVHYNKAGSTNNQGAKP